MSASPISEERALALEALSRARELPFVSLVSFLAQGLGGAAVGGDGPVSQERVLFSGAPELGFASAELQAAELAGDVARLELNFGGLVGAGSPLPPSMIEELAARDDDTRAERALLDIFHHRLHGLAYRGLCKFDLARSPLGRAPALAWMLGLAGLPSDERAAERVSGLPLRLLWRLTPLLLVYPANAARLVAALRVVLPELAELPVRVNELRGGAAELEPDSRARLGVDMRLGQTASVGGRTPVPGGAITVALGPLAPGLASSLTSAGRRKHLLEATLCLFCPETIDVELELHVAPGASAALGQCRLGRSAWLGSHGAPEPVRWWIRKKQGGDPWTDPSWSC